MQPYVLQVIGSREGFHGRGLLARFLFALPQSFVGRREAGSPPIAEDAHAAYRDRMRRLVETLAGWEGDPVRMTFTVDANAELLAFERALEPTLGEGGELGHVADWGSKLAGAVVRIAALLHLAEADEAWRRSVDVTHVRAAITLGDYFRAHALAVADVMRADVGRDDARALLVWATGRPPWSRRDAMRAMQTRFPDVETLDAALHVLDVYGYLRTQPAEPPRPLGAGRAAARRFEVREL